MKKILGIVVLSLFICNTASFAFTKGTGEVKMTPRAVNHFIKYIKGESNIKSTKSFEKKPTPSMFILSSDGDWTMAWYCPYTQCADSRSAKTIKDCERETGTTCGVFASRRTIYWENGINKKNKKARFKSKMTNSEIRAKLTEIGFLGGSTSKTTTTTPKITKKKKKETKKVTKNSSDLINKLKDLKELRDNDVLTDEEFLKAKKKLLE
jgi:hypothetical protein